MKAKDIAHVLHMAQSGAIELKDSPSFQSVPKQLLLPAQVKKVGDHTCCIDMDLLHEANGWVRYHIHSPYHAYEPTAIVYEDENYVIALNYKPKNIPEPSPYKNWILWSITLGLCGSVLWSSVHRSST